jgi:hypothetical protein
MIEKPFVYIASPYTKTDPCINTHAAMKLFDDLMTEGIVLPFTPLLSHFQHTLFPRPYKDWIEYDLAILGKFDAVLRVNVSVERADIDFRYMAASSSGADGEVKRAEELGIPVFCNIDDLHEWAKAHKTEG